MFQGIAHHAKHIYGVIDPRHLSRKPRILQAYHLVDMVLYPTNNTADKIQPIGDIKSCKQKRHCLHLSSINKNQVQH